jgi:diguanylate cyclase (GGDEF)-like protein/PAS domain S-box-containing protein
MVWEVDQNGKYTYVSPKVKGILGYEPGEIIGKSPLQMMPPEEAERLAKVFGNITKAQKPLTRVENINLNKNKQQIVLETSGVPIFDAHGNFTGYRGISRDVTERKRIEEELRKLSNAVKQSPVSVVITDTKGIIEYVNPRFTELTGYTPDEVIGKTPRILKSGKTSASEYKRLWDTITQGKEWRGEFCNRKKNGELYWDYAYISPIRNSEGVITHFLAVKENITERKNFEVQLAHLASCDPLTNLLNRRRFHEELENCLAQARRYGNKGAVMFLDVDNFKYINDTLGHQAGDKLLVDLATLLRKRMRKTDTLARLGGDEFAIILPHVDVDQAQSIAINILESVRNNIIVNKRQSLSITVSIGIALFPEHGDDAETLLSYADLSLYRAKEEGRNRIRVFSPDHKIQIESRLDWERRIRDALKNDLFVLHLQPILDIRRNVIVGYEALLRMRDDKKGLISPINFLGIAEHCGLISEIDQWVARRGIRLAAEQQFEERGLFLDVNLSGKAFTNPELLPLIKETFAESGINPQSLVFEITETAVIENITEAQRFIAHLKAMGCRFALDDFGIGLSSLSYLKHFAVAVDYLKIDGSFIGDLAHDSVDQHLVRAIVEVARGLGKQTVAESVGCKETVQLLLEYGVDYAQGYLIGMPTAVPEVQVL